MKEPDDELLDELKRVGSDLGFRKRVRRSIRAVILFITVDLIISGIAIFALVSVKDVQREACERDNILRKSYVDQWTPLIADNPLPPEPPDDAPQEVKDNYNKQKRSHDIFIDGLSNGFAQHPC